MYFIKPFLLFIEDEVMNSYNLVRLLFFLFLNCYFNELY